MNQVHGASSESNIVMLVSADIPTLTNEHQAQELRPLQSQVAGHSADNGKSSSGMLLHPDGYVLKPADKKIQRENEIRFYQHLNSALDPISQELREYVPKFYGTRNVTLNGKDIPCIVLQNATEGMLEPCVMDVKIGKQTWEPNASEEKRNIEKAKYVESKRECGFCIPGMQFYDITSQELVKYGKEYGKQLDRNGIKDALKLFLNWSSSISRPLILQFLCKLWKILRWFQYQRQFLFYASSILFVYDAHPLRNYSPPVAVFGEGLDEDSLQNCGVCEVDELSKGNETIYLPGGDEEQQWTALKEGSLKDFDELQKCISQEVRCVNKLADVKMIDFAHTMISSGCNSDSNYIEGLQNLIAIFEILLKESC